MSKLNKKTKVYLTITLMLLIIMGATTGFAQVHDSNYRQNETFQERHDGTYIKIDDDGTYLKLGPNTTYLKLEDDNLIKPLAEDACPGWGKHDMVSAGWATLVKVGRDGSRERVFVNGSSWQCSRCKEVLATEYDPLEARYVGYYVMRSSGDWITPSTIIEAYPEQIKFTSGSKVPNCILRYDF